MNSMKVTMSDAAVAETEPPNEDPELDRARSISLSQFPLRGMRRIVGDRRKDEFTVGPEAKECAKS